MSKAHIVTANGAAFQARPGELILDCALRNGIDYPHDCRAGRCGSCLTRVVKGLTFGGESLHSGMVHACLARVLTDLELQFEDLPPVNLIHGRVTSLVSRSFDVIEVGITLDEPFDFYPGQYCRFKFKGYPERSFSPTWPADLARETDDITLHVKRVRGGLVSNALGNEIAVGHRLTVEGPFGVAFYRSSVGQRLVLVAGGTGFAPILSIAMSALAEDSLRSIEVIVGTRTVEQLYMATGLVALSKFPGVKLSIAASEVPDHLQVVRRGSPADFLPDLTDNDVVYVAGAPSMVSKVAEAAESVGAEFYSDPFVPGRPRPESWLRRLAARASGRGGTDAARRDTAPAALALTASS